MLECLIYLCVWAIVALIVWIVLSKILGMFWGGIDSRIMQLVGLLFGLIILVWTLRCMGLLSRIPPFLGPSG
jgi:hypothetical protein